LTRPRDSDDRQPPLIGVVGPTASGKTDLALALADRLPVEIVVADSRQVFRGMDVGTAKPDTQARRRVPHHLIDVVDPDEPFTVADWVGHARRVVGEVAERGRLPLLVGGTGLYVSALIDGHDYAAQPWSPEIRRRLADELQAGGLAPLTARLESADPAEAAAVDLRNPRRVLRALERIEAGGGGATPRSTPYAGRVALIALNRPRDVLYRRIDERAAWLFTNGLLDEVRRLRDDSFGPELHPMTGHGYAEAAAHLAGEATLGEAVAVTARRTRQYAKRQLTWFRRDPRLLWIPAGDRPGDDPEIVERAERMLRGALS
jgi:tRNA dimethylallyltransferase